MVVCSSFYGEKTEKPSVYIPRCKLKKWDEECHCCGDKTKCDLNALRDAEYNSAAISQCVSSSIYRQIKWERDMAIDQLKDIGLGLGEKFWRSATIDPPSKNGLYLVARYGLRKKLGVDILWFATDLHDAIPLDFEGEHRPGWYDYDSEVGYIEIDEVVWWAKTPKTPGEADDG